MAAPKDERLLRDSFLKRLLRRPELGAVGGTVLVWLFFAYMGGDRGFLTYSGTANYLEVAAQLGIMAVPVALLMISGEFDLSIGSIIGGAGMTIGILSMHYHWNLWAAIGAAFLVSIAIGAINGILVVRTKLPSFIITLGSQFIIRGATVALSRLITKKTLVDQIKNADGYNSAAKFFASSYDIIEKTTRHTARGNIEVTKTAEFPVSILWWAIIAALATYVLLRTRPGNWIFGIGGDVNAARNMGVPVNRTKVTLFILTAVAGWLVATIQVVDLGSADTTRGMQREFFAIIAVVIGGTLLTGGYGSAIGAVFGALTVAIVQQCFYSNTIDSDWSYTFLGGMLIVAVLINNFIRRRVSGVK
jgi:simple sugar transport system permease protein